MKKIASVVVTTATVVSLSGLAPLAANAQLTSDLQSQINALLAQIATLQSQLAGAPAAPAVGGAGACYSYTRNLTVGSKGDDVTALQQFLAAQGDLQVSATGYFGALTKAALAKFQSRNAISPAVGYFGPMTRAKVSSMCVAAPAPVGGGPAPVVPAPAVSGALVIKAAPVQPANTLAPFNATNLPFTKVLVENGTASEITLNSITAERTGLAADAAFASLVLLNSDGVKVGNTKTLNSDHRADVGEAMKIPANSVVELYVAANRAVAGALGGQTAKIKVVGASASIAVSLVPATGFEGAEHTINESLSIGTVTVARGPLDPASSQSKEVGTLAYVFSSVKVTAGSEEKVYLRSIRWNQTGSAGSSDLKNVKVKVDGVAYDTSISSDGKYYTAVFPGKGILMDKGFSKEATIVGDVMGGSGRTVDFDIAKRSDISLVGELYGYGLRAPQTGTTDPTDDTAAFSSVEDPWYDAAQVTVSSGTLNVTANNLIAPAQNIAINLADQSIGGFQVDVKGESVSVGQIVFNWFLVDNTGTDPAGTDIDNVKLVKEDGTVVAGPIDAAGAGLSGTITFSNSITFPVGLTNLILKAKLATNFANNDTIRASSTPSSDWSTVSGVTTGVTITPSPTSAVSGNIMTVKGAALTISVSTVPIAQTLIAGSQYEFARYILDAAASGEDLRMNSIPLEYNLGGGTATDLTNCGLYDGSTQLNTGTNLVNPSAAASSTVFTFDGSGIVLVKGYSKQYSLKCTLRAGATGKYTWGYDGASSPSATGVVSGQDATVTENDGAGQSMTAAAGGTLSVALDSSSPAYALASPGQVVELAKIKYTAVNENVSIRQIALELSGPASNTPINLVGQMVELYDGSKKIGEATFTGIVDDSSQDVATSSLLLAADFVVPRDGAKILTVKGTIAGISASGPMTRSSDLLIVDYDGNNNGLTGNYGVGVSSGSTISPTGADTASNGVRIMKAYPTLSKIDLSSSERTLVAGDDKTLYKFKVTANNGDVALYKFSFSVSSSTVKGGGANATTTKFSLFVFTDSGFSTPDALYSSSANPGGLVNSGNCWSGKGLSTAQVGGGNTSELMAPASVAFGNGAGLAEIYVDRTSCNGATTTLIVSSGATRWFRFSASVGVLPPSGTSENIQVQMEGDAAFPTRQQVGLAVVGDMGRSGSPLAGSGTADTGVDTDANDDFIWSPLSTTSSSAVSDLDFTNGYGLIGLPSANMSPETLSK